MADPDRCAVAGCAITCTDIPDTGIAGVPGSHHPQYIDTVHREHAVVETGGVRTAKAMGLRNLPSKSWQVSTGLVIAANISAGLTAWTRLLGCHDHQDLRDSDPDTLRYRIWHIPVRLARHARECILKISPGRPWKDAFLTCLPGRRPNRAWPRAGGCAATPAGRASRPAEGCAAAGFTPADPACWGDGA